MLIRSQDKKCLTNMAQVTDVYCSESMYVKGTNITAGLASAETTPLGRYSTDEKAVKVLDMICEEYQHNERCRARCEEDGTIPLYVFQMPQDEEVE